MSPEMIEYLIDFPTEKHITISKADGFIQQLCGRYSKKCLKPAEHILNVQKAEEKRSPDQKKRGCKVLQLVHEIDAEIIEAESLPFYNNDLYFNMNKQEDYQYVINRLKEKWTSL
jgi:molybdopterin-guanine dinucleotide biosynthesis protein A